MGDWQLDDLGAGEWKELTNPFLMNLAGWFLPSENAARHPHTALCSVTGLVAMALNANNGDWVMWRVGRQMLAAPCCDGSWAPNGGP